MIIGIGSDIVYVDRFEKIFLTYGEQFLNRIFTKNEQAYAKKSVNIFNIYAKRFAAKEAFSKAIGTGFRNGLRWKDIEISRTKLGQPFIIVHERAKKIIEPCHGPLDMCKIHLSLSDEKHLAQAFVIIEK